MRKEEGWKQGQLPNSVKTLQLRERQQDEKLILGEEGASSRSMMRCKPEMSGQDL